MGKRNIFIAGERLNLANAARLGTFGPEVDHLQSDHLAKLDNLIQAAWSARNAARAGDLFFSREGQALVNAMHDLTEVDGLYDFAADIDLLVSRGEP